MMLLTFMKSCPSMKVMEPGFGTGAPMAYRIPNSAPIFPVLPTRLQTHVPAYCPAREASPEMPAFEGPPEDERNSWRLGDHLGVPSETLGLDAGSCMAAPRFPGSAPTFLVRIQGSPMKTTGPVHPWTAQQLT